ncbi:hypothetical protein SAMN06298211_10337 [Prevotellaceae bacterium MN60]|nr:hypothetical protein SAMN06298211_10337 [Prevotellaceae bacterium MN60]
MKLNALALSLLLSCMWLTATAQDNVNTKFGKPTKEEMQMTVYAPEPDAEAVVLCRLTDVTYTIQSSGYLVDYREKFRIKVLKPSGARYAKVVIPYSKNELDKANAKLITKTQLRLGVAVPNDRAMGDFYDEATGTSSVSENIMGEYTDENIEEIKAVAFNLVNGKVVKSKLDASDIKNEKIEGDDYQVSFTVPDVKEGTVIEYEYLIHSELYYRMHDWVPQCEIPVAYARLDMEIPSFLIYNIEDRGIQRLVTTCSMGKMHYQVESAPSAPPASIPTNHYISIGRNLKSMPKDAYIWNPNDYRAGISGELKSYRVRGGQPIDYAKTWNEIDDIILDDEDLGKRLDNHSPLQKELEAANIQNIADEQERIAAVYKLVMNRVKWNGKYELWPDAENDILAKGEGNNADINILLIQSLRDMSINASPVVLRERSKGELPQSFPSINKLTTYIVGIMQKNGTMAYLDASSTGGWLNVLPEVLLVNRARIVDKKNKSPWVNLQKVSRSQITTVIDAVLTADGKLSGTETTLLRGLAAIKYRQLNGKSNEFAQEEKVEKKISVQGEVNDGIISICPFYEAPISENPFTAESRMLPVEFPSEQSQQVVVNITLPEGYMMEKGIEQTIASTPDKGLNGRLIATTGDGKVTVQYQFNINKTSHAEKNYPALRQMYDLFITHCKDKLIIKHI